VTGVSEVQQRWYHVHHTSRGQRHSLPTDGYGQYPCITCKVSPHPVKAGERYAIYLSSSTLANWQGRRSKNGYTGDDIHLDYLCIPGGTIKTLRHAFAAEYQYFWKPMDVVFASGLNDLLRGYDAADMWAEIKVFKEYVQELGKKHGHENTFAVCTLLYPPKLCQLQRDPWRRYNEDWTDRTWDIFHLNEEIIKINGEGSDAQYTRRAPQFHTYGLKTAANYGRGNRLGTLNKHKLCSWREKRFEDMLHLNDHYRLKMGKMIVNYFTYIYGMKECAYLTREDERNGMEHAEQPKDARRAIMQRKEKRLVSEVKANRNKNKYRLDYNGQKW